MQGRKQQLAQQQQQQRRRRRGGFTRSCSAHVTCCTSSTPSRLTCSSTVLPPPRALPRGPDLGSGRPSIPCWTKPLRPLWRRQQLPVSCCSHYDVLGVGPQSQPEVIKAAFRRAVKRLHPDVNKTPAAEQQFMRVTQAYEVLSDAELRAAHDQELDRMRPRAPASAQGPGRGRVEYSWGVDLEDLERRLYDELDAEEGEGGEEAEEEGVGYEDDFMLDEDEGEGELHGMSDFLNWSCSLDDIPRGSTEDVWSSSSKRRQRQQAQVRAEAERQARQAAAAAAAAAAVAAAEASRRKGHWSVRPQQATIGGFSTEEVLHSLGPDARLTAKNLFGPKLEKLASVEQLSNFLELLEVLRDDMGVPLQIFDPELDEEKPSGSRAGGVGGRGGSGGFGERGRYSGVPGAAAGGGEDDSWTGVLGREAPAGFRAVDLMSQQAKQQAAAGRPQQGQRGQARPAYGGSAGGGGGASAMASGVPKPWATRGPGASKVPPPGTVPKPPETPQPRARAAPSNAVNPPPSPTPKPWSRAPAAPDAKPSGTPKPWARGAPPNTVKASEAPKPWARAPLSNTVMPSGTPKPWSRVLHSRHPGPGSSASGLRVDEEGSGQEEL